MHLPKRRIESVVLIYTLSCPQYSYIHIHIIISESCPCRFEIYSTLKLLKLITDVLYGCTHTHTQTWFMPTLWNEGFVRFAAAAAAAVAALYIRCRCHRWRMPHNNKIVVEWSGKLKCSSCKSIKCAVIDLLMHEFDFSLIIHFVRKDDEISGPYALRVGLLAYMDVCILKLVTKARP